MSEYKVLIVEDNKINMKIMRDLLGVHGYQTLEAGDGPVCLDMAQTHRPELILMDIQLPTMNGYEVTRSLKEQDETKNIPIVVVTSLAMKGEKDQAR